MASRRSSRKIAAVRLPYSSLASFGLSDLGRKRATNEDAYFTDDQLGLYVVADGMGGHAAGEVASQEAVETVFGMVKRGSRELAPLCEPLDDAAVRSASRLMESAIQAATYMVFSMAEMDRGKTGMGTTLSALLVLGEFSVTAQVGDSRVYRISADKAEQITEDHRVVVSSEQSYLGRALGIKRANLVPLLASLQARGLVGRRAVDGDRRAAALHLAPDGAALLRRADEALYEAKREQHADAHAFPSSIDKAHFGQARGPLAEPTEWL